MAEDLLAADVAAGEEFGDVLIGRPVDGNAEVVAVLGLEVRFVLVVVEPVVTEPVEVRELLVGKLVELLVRCRRERAADEVLEVETGIGDILAFIGHEVRQVAHLLVTPMGADEVAVVDPAIVKVLAGLHLGLDLFDNVTFLDKVVRHLDAGNGGKCRRQNL